MEALVIVFKRRAIEVSVTERELVIALTGGRAIIVLSEAWFRQRLFYLT